MPTGCTAELHCGCLHAGNGGLAGVLQLVHLFLDKPQWETAAMERAKQAWTSHYRSLTKSLERATADRVMAAMLGPERYSTPLIISCSLLVQTQQLTAG